MNTDHGREARILIVASFLCGAVLLAAHSQRFTAQESKAAPQEREGVNPEQQEPKNLQVLKGMTTPQVITVMRGWAKDLGVECNYCHVRPFEADTPRKSVARLMERDYIMGMKLRNGNALTCADCHQGQPDFLRARPFDNVVGKQLPDIRVLRGMGKEQLDHVMDGFAQSLGVKCSYCHVRPFTADTPRKQVARFMVTDFIRGLVKQDGKAVGCADCHQGQSRLLSVLPFPRRPERRQSNGNPPQPRS